MEKEINTSKGQAEGEVIVDASATPKETVSSVDTLSLKEINEHLGKTYKDKESALKSLKDTFSFVGKKIEQAAPVASESNNDVAKQLKEMKTDLFYSKNPDYEPYRGVISKMGENPADVVQTPEFKDVFVKAAGYDKIQKSKTVLESNPRIGMVRNKQTEAIDAVSKRDYNKANRLATESVIEALEL